MPINWDKWEFTRNDPDVPLAMAERHAEMLEAFVRHSGAKTAVELGSYKGRSTVAFIEAKRNGAALEWLGLCDPVITQALRWVVMAGQKIMSVDFVEAHSNTVTWNADLWMIDANHEEAWARHDVMLAEKNGARFIAMHDVSNATCPGVGKVAAECLAAYQNQWRDTKYREGEVTSAGILFASKEPFQQALLDEWELLAL